MLCCLGFIKQVFWNWKKPFSSPFENLDIILLSCIHFPSLKLEIFPWKGCPLTLCCMRNFAASGFNSPPLPLSSVQFEARRQQSDLQQGSKEEQPLHTYVFGIVLIGSISLWIGGGGSRSTVSKSWWTAMSSTQCDHQSASAAPSTTIIILLLLQSWLSLSRQLLVCLQLRFWSS